MNVASRFKQLFGFVPPVPQDNPARNPTSSEFEVDGWALSRFVIEVLVPKAGWHPFPLPELMLMSGTVCRLKPSLIFEWGTNIGKSAWIFQETARHYRIPCEVHSMDLPPTQDHIEHPGSRRGEMVRGLAGVVLHEGDGLATALEIWNSRGRDPRPLFFVDGDHSYESVKRELDGILQAVPEASVLLHDTFYQSPDSGYNVGPRQAIEETLAAHPGRFGSLHTGTSLPGMTLLTPRIGARFS